MEISTMQQASAAVAERQPIAVVLGDGRTAIVGTLPWMSCKKLWSQVQGLVSAGIRAWNSYELQSEARQMFKQSTVAPMLTPRLAESGADKFEPLSPDAYGPITKATQDTLQRASGSFDLSIDNLLARADELPGFVEALIGGAARVDGKALTAPEIEALAGTDVMRLARAAYKFNFEDNQEIRDFFGGVLRGLRLSMSYGSASNDELLNGQADAPRPASA